MKTEILIFLFCGFCFNIVASYQYPEYRQAAYQQHRDWSNNQNYHQNPNTDYQLRHPVTYRQPQQVVNYVQGPPEPIFVQGPPENTYVQSPPESTYVQSSSDQSYAQHQDANVQEKKQESVYTQHQQEASSQQQVIDNQSDTIFVEQPISISDSSYLPPPERPYESYGSPQPGSWQSTQPPSQVYVPERYSQQVPRLWSAHNSYQPVAPISQPISYPNWQSSGYKNVQQQNQHHGSSYDGQTTYYSPVQYTVQPQQIAPADSTASATSDNYRDILASKPEVKKYLETEPDKKRFLLIHPNGTVEYVDVVDDSLLGNSHLIKSSDIINGKDYQEKITVKPHEKPGYNNIGSSTPLSDNYKKENYKNNDYLSKTHPNVQNKTKNTVPVNDDYTKNYYNQRYVKTNYTEGSTISPVDHYNIYRHNPMFKSTHIRPHANRKHEKNKLPQSPHMYNNNNNNYKKNHEPQQSKTDIIFAVNDKRFYNNDSPYNKDKEIIKNDFPSFYPTKTNSETSYISTTTETVAFNNYQNPTYDSSPTNEKNDYYNSSENKNPNNPPWNREYDETTIPTDYMLTTTATYYETETEAPQFDETNKTNLQYHFQNHSKSDESETYPTFEPPKSTDYDLVDIDDENQVKKSYDVDKTNVQNKPKKDSPSIDKDKYNSGAVTNNSGTSTLRHESTVYEKTNVTDAANDNGRIYKSKPNTTDMQDNANDDNVSDDDDEITDSFYPSATAADGIITLSPVEKGSPLNEDSPTDDDTTDIGDEETEEQETTTLVQEPVKTSYNKEVEVDFANLKKVSKSMFWFRPSEDFWDKLYEGNETGGYDDLYIFNVKISDPVVEKSSKSFAFENGTIVEETEEIVWEHKCDEIPREIKVTKIIRNPKPSKLRNNNEKKGQKTDPAVATKC